MALAEKLNYEIHGRQNGETILMLHGLLSSRNHWLPNLPALTQSFQVVAPDLPAHGRSPAPRDARCYRLDALVAMLDDLRKELILDSWHLVGQSFGAGLVLHYALTHPEATRTITITNANRALLPSLSSAERTDLAERVARLVALGAEQLRREPVHPRFARFYPNYLRHILTEDAENIDPLGFALLLRSASPDLSARENLGQIQCPMLLVNGHRERKFQPVRNWIAENHQQIEIVDLDGGHSINIENAPEFDQTLLSFLAAYGAHPYRNSCSCSERRRIQIIGNQQLKESKQRRCI